MPILLSVIVVNWNLIDDLRACLRSLHAQTERELDVIVVDNGSTDGSADMVAAEFPEFRLLRETENLGFAEGCNRGVKASVGPWVAMLNNDAVAESDWAAALVAAAAAVPPECGMLQSLLLYQAPPHAINSAGIELTRSGGGRPRQEGQPRTAAGEACEIFCPTAGAAAYRRSMLDTIRLSGGYFDRTHFMYYEDTDLGWRARLAGYSAQYVPDSVVYHRRHGSSERRGRAWRETIVSTNRLRTQLKNASWGLILRTVPWSVKGLLKVARHGGPDGLLAWLKAIPESLSGRTEVSALLKAGRREVERHWQGRAG